MDGGSAERDLTCSPLGVCASLLAVLSRRVVLFMVRPAGYTGARLYAPLTSTSTSRRLRDRGRQGEGKPVRSNGAAVFCAPIYSRGAVTRREISACDTVTQMFREARKTPRYQLAILRTILRAILGASEELRLARLENHRLASIITGNNRTRVCSLSI